MSWLSDAAVGRLRHALAAPDLDNPRYELRAPIGQGGMGTVYRALDRELGREVAVKVMRDASPDPAGVRRLLQEARVIAQLEHPGIVPVHDVGRLSDGRVYYVMKLVRGRRLDEYVDAGGQFEERLRIFERVCETVAFAHAHGVIHRDLKPENVMVGGFGEVLVLDWGVAKLRGTSDPSESTSTAVKTSASNSTAGASAQDTRTRQTALGTIIGTPAYMSPEQARGDVDRVDERSDVFALGAILHFLLTGTAPVTQSMFERQRRGEHLPHPRLPTVARGASRALAAVCAKAMHPDAAERYASAGELAVEIGRFRSGQRVSAHREGLFERMRRLGWKYRVPVLLVLAYLLMRLLLIFFERT